MRKGVITISVLLLLTLSDMFPKDKRDDSYIIRKAYIDTLGVFPTVEEMDWYCVYNTDGYQIAVEYLSNKTDKNAEEVKNWLFSEEYQQEVKSKLTSEELDRAICYFTGEKYSADLEQKKKARLAFVAYAKLEAVSDMEVIDNMANMLMSRATKKDEANQLLACLSSAKNNMPEDAAWLEVLKTLLELEDVSNK